MGDVVGMKCLSTLGGWLSLCLLACFAWGGCVGTADVGKDCALTLAASKKSLAELKSTDETRIIEPSFDCDFPYCVANFNNPDKPDKGYCTRTCRAIEDCPDNTKYKCIEYVQAPVGDLPEAERKRYSSLISLVGEKLCIKIPPTQQPATQ